MTQKNNGSSNDFLPQLNKKRRNTPSITYNFTLISSDLNKKSEVGNFLLSQEAALQVPSADTRLTAGFGMFPGIPTLLWSPTSLFIYLFIDSRGTGPFRVQSLFSYNM